MVLQYFQTVRQLAVRLINLPEYGRFLGKLIVRVWLQFLVCLSLVDQGDFVVECLGERGFEM